MSAEGTNLLVFGHIGFEEEIDSHIKTRVMFAVADQKRTQLAWYLFTQAMAVKTWDNAFTLASMGVRKLDRNERFATAGPMNPMPVQCDFKFQVGKLAPAIVRSDGAWGTLDLNDDAATGTTSCLVYIDVQPNGVILPFDLKTESRRRTLNIKKRGRVYLLGVEHFSHHALGRGPTRSVTPMDPYDPMM
jgi:hypothetical protein